MSETGDGTAEKDRLSERTVRIMKQYTTEELVKISMISAKPEN